MAGQYFRRLPKCRWQYETCAVQIKFSVADSSFATFHVWKYQDSFIANQWGCKRKNLGQDADWIVKLVNGFRFFSRKQCFQEQNWSNNRRYVYCRSDWGQVGMIGISRCDYPWPHAWRSHTDASVGHRIFWWLAQSGDVCPLSADCPRTSPEHCSLLTDRM